MEEKKISGAFQKIYQENLWGDADSRSGSGSNMEQTRIIRQELPVLFDKLGVKAIVDAPCGDVFWMKTLFPYFATNGIRYTGLDIVPEIIKGNTETFRSYGFEFRQADLTTDMIPCVDLIFTRDCLLHLSYMNIYRMLSNFKASGSKYILVSTYTKPDRINFDVEEFSVGGRALNLQKFPFNLKKPEHIIAEGCTEGNMMYTDKSLAFWKLEDIDLDEIKDSILRDARRVKRERLKKRVRNGFDYCKITAKRIIKKLLFIS